MIQHLHPELVHDDRLEEARDGGVVRIEDAVAYRHGARTFYDSRENSDNGVFGDQTGATPEKGEQLFEAACDQLVRLCQWLDAREFEDLVPAEHV